MTGDKIKQITDYNAMESGVWNSDILPLLNELKARCDIAHIPFVASFAVANENGHTEYVHDGVLPDESGSGLYDNRFGKYLLALQDGSYVSPYNPEHNMQDAIEAYNADNGDDEDDEENE